ncbi:MAG: type II toxin-antitoxin system RelE/ParE family toxin [Blastocatellia bacterium]|nr:type II toxin-antitoxin system RelE/ParE family toxin [Blastocatellia bacterium]
MNVSFRSSFARDPNSITDKNLLRRVRQAVEDVEHAQSVNDLPNLKKLKSSKNYYRLRIGDYRIGLALEDDALVFVRFLNRKEIYRYFP